MYTILIDFSYIFYKSLSVCRYHYKKELDLTNQEDRGFIIRKVTTDLCKIIRELNYSEVYFCFDYKGSWRKSLYDVYKGDREEKEPYFKETQEEVFDIYTNLGLKCLRVEGLEADDLISLLHSSITGTKIIVTKDEDLRQLLDRTTFCYIPDSKDKTFYYYDDRQVKYKPKEGEEYRYEKADSLYILFLKILKGCSTDRIPPLLPKGYRTNKILQHYEVFQKEEDGTLSEKVLLAILQDNTLHHLSIEDVELQLKLVCLREEYFPIEKVEQYSNILSNLKSLSYTGDFYMKEILKNTPYIDIVE